MHLVGAGDDKGAHQEREGPKAEENSEQGGVVTHSLTDIVSDLFFYRRDSEGWGIRKSLLELH